MRRSTSSATSPIPSPTSARSSAASAALIAAPYVSSAYGAGSLSVGLWDHWVPGANDVALKVIQDWGAKEKVEVKVDFITSQGNNILLRGEITTENLEKLIKNLPDRLNR